MKINFKCVECSSEDYKKDCPNGIFFPDRFYRKYINEFTPMTNNKFFEKWLKLSKGIKPFKIKKSGCTFIGLKFRGSDFEFYVLSSKGKSTCYECIPNFQDKTIETIEEYFLK